MPLQRLTNPVRDYPWGSTSTIPALLGRPANGRPQAELWLGAHPDSPSTLRDGTGLDDTVAGDPEAHLGGALRSTYGPRLPFLLKVLAAAAPLSLQVHPTSEQARAGYDDEQARGVAPDAHDRRYHDPFHKPEMIVALGTFEVLCGLRDLAETATLLDRLDVEHPCWAQLRAHLVGSDPEAALRETVGWLLGDDPQVPGLVDAVAAAAERHPDRARTPELATTADLAADYPGDPGVLVGLLMNRVRLAPGEALFLPAGVLHSYLHGTGVEIMAASDNVLRAGLTGKHVDVPELLRVADFAPRPLPYVDPDVQGPLSWYRPDVEDFLLVKAELDDPEQCYDVALPGPRLLLVLDGDVQVAVGDAPSEHLVRGESAYVAATAGGLRLRGAGVAVVAGSPAAEVG